MEEKEQKVLVAGASGATGRLLVEQLLRAGHHVRVVVRSKDSFPVQEQAKLEIMESSLLDLDDLAMARLVEGRDAVASCLGHNLSLKGIYGKPRMLVRDATKRLCQAVLSYSPEKPVKFVLMNTSGLQCVLMDS